ncbi:esterase family protein [Paenibacillus sp. ACRRX]|uniref:alpha/beta hydrolase n=1 Tax=unclassified Paenibacillus TaxID=185978 RepID=UPI001EF5E355|nr:MULTISPECIES: alpha/beta hydrolase family protein [unclassified Paenibacillus]MCG7408192.1 esterase family protein [Paenibacillus sp. ACRRX]MDK8181424.1 alpha/beta hydrolase family protein [Paenibacillus sp. UMB4589-SE434]
MALMNCSFYSEVLGLNTEMTVIVPQQTTTQIGLEGHAAKSLHPTLYLLHGLSDDHTIWIRRTSIERYAAQLGLAVVIPQVHRSFYTDMYNGLAYWTFLTEELPKLAQGFFPLSDKREDNYVAGLSMGGYGAFKWALTHPERFAAAASLSGALDIGNDVFRQRLARDMQLIFGDQPISGTENDLLHLLKKGDQEQGLKPKLYQCCGTEDFLYEDNLKFRDTARHTTYELHYEEGPGEHEWGYWDARIQDVLAWLPLRKEQE